MAKSDAEPLDLPAVPAPFGKKPLRTFALAVALPALLLYVLSAVLTIGALTMMARDIDTSEDSRAMVAMHAALNSFVSDLGNAVSDEGTWNEAYLNVVVTPSAAWMDQTWGETARIGLNYDTVLVTDADGEIVFGENSAGALKGNIAGVFPAATAMLDHLDKGIAATGDLVTVSNFSADKAGAAGLAAISIHQSSPNTLTVPRQSRRVLWIARHLTPALLQDISTHYQLPLAALVDAPGAESSSIQLSDAAGDVVATLAWVPDRPGEAAFNRALLPATAVFFGIGIALIAGLGIVRRAMLRHGRRVLEAQQNLVATMAQTTAAGLRQRRSDDRPETSGSPARPFATSGRLASANPGTFTIAYQPSFDIRAEALMGVEALLRWDHEGDESLAQEELAPDAHAALLDRVGLMAIRQAAGDLAPMLGTPLSIATTPEQLGHVDFAEKTLATLGAMTLPPHRLQLNLDCTLLPALDTIRNTVAVLREAGVTFALDGFVMTPVALEAVDAGLVDRVRLSPALALGLEQSLTRQKLAAAAIDILHAAGVRISVAGVEKRDDVARLLRLGITEFQGTLFAAPLPIKAITQLLLAPPVKRAS